MQFPFTKTLLKQDYLLSWNCFWKKKCRSANNHQSWGSRQSSALNVLKQFIEQPPPPFQQTVLNRSKTKTFWWACPLPPEDCCLKNMTTGQPSWRLGNRTACKCQYLIHTKQRKQPADSWWNLMNNTLRTTALVYLPMEKYPLWGTRAGYLCSPGWHCITGWSEDRLRSTHRSWAGWW